MKHSRTAALIGAVVTTVGLLAACSSSLSQTDVQAKLTEAIGGGATVSCPSDIPIAVGGTFVCDITNADGTSGQITVTQDDDQGNVSWKQTS